MADASYSSPLTLLSEMATNSPRSQALASLNITPEELEKHTEKMRSFLATAAAAGLDAPVSAATTGETSQHVLADEPLPPPSSEPDLQSTPATTRKRVNSARNHVPIAGVHRNTRSRVSPKTAPSTPSSSADSPSPTSNTTAVVSPIKAQKVSTRNNRVQEDALKAPSSPTIPVPSHT
ncbi:hypothetical protein BS47DRAFT_1359362 [Hydnum rufescens UP504]|uniref:Uncharacterized protein n=1 Tax=Hydnum rufescens UP504 TaxID=1448309 RepID=A0A9P6E138_9AGAM|nr:hypothetical protein BS47DRAFT_1359362 [Hydnum rufescens UP504]